MSQTQTSTKPRLFKRSKPKDKEITTRPQKKEKFLPVKKTEQVFKEKKFRPSLKFPKIPRVIPDKPSISRLKWVSIVALSVLALVWNYFALQNLFLVGKSWVSLLVERQKLHNEMVLWGNITKEFPSYRDAYFEGAVLAYRLGDRGQLAYFLGKLKLIDPNFPLTDSLEKLVSLQNLE